MKILGIDTSTTIFSACLCEDEKILIELRRERSFSEDSRDANLFRTVQYLMKLLNNEKLGAIALSLGPGMFTSLRVGLGLAKGLYLSHNVPVYGINTLEVIAKSFFPFNAIKSIHNRIVCAAVIEAFQNEFFVALYGPRGKIGNDLLVTARGLMDHLNRKLKKVGTIIVVGPGARSIKQNEIFRKNWINEKRLLILDSDLYFTSASKVVNVALSRIKSGKCDNPDLLEPYYIKKTTAETKSSKK